MINCPWGAKLVKFPVWYTNSNVPVIYNHNVLVDEGLRGINMYAECAKDYRPSRHVLT